MLAWLRTFSSVFFFKCFILLSFFFLGQEHGAVQAAVQLTDAEILALQLGTQKSWMKALALVTKAKGYFPQAYVTLMTRFFVFR